MKHDLWKISSPTVSPRALCSVRSRVPWPLVNWNFGPGCISGQKHQGSDETPLGRMQQTPCGLSPWADGRGNVGKSCGCCDDPCTPRDLNNSHTCHPTYPNIRPKDLVHRESRHHPRGGVNRHLMLQPPKQPGPEFKFARGHGTRGRPQHRFFGLTVGHG